MGPPRRSRYRAGQVWSYRTRAQEPRSRACIVRVDELEDGRSIYHLFVDGLSMASPNGPDGRQEVLSHAPVSVETLDASLVAPLDEPPPDRERLEEFEQGYALWREAFEADEAGFFLMPVADIVQHVEDVLCGLEESG